MTKIHQITPFLHVPDLQEALAFFCDLLTFELKHREATTPMLSSLAAAGAFWKSRRAG